ncbi:DUF2798 domain-containing protein [Terasakiella pusilla]|uniref:DUF2798 domain-containing protein n=1 Tax=Terasakiella pusilla TaxID=64973 RepID=UPI003AA8F414
MKQRLVFSLVMSLILSFLMTLWVTWINLGFIPDFVSQWLRAFGMAWPAAAVISFFTAPLVQVMCRKICALLEGPDKTIVT